jgi:hypothetical protein
MKIHIERKNERKQFRENCVLCGKELVYFRESKMMECSLCHEQKLSSCACRDGHFVCDACHRKQSDAAYLPYLMQSRERDPLRLFEAVIEMEGVHMHGPEHHAIVPCVLLTAYRNCGGEIDLSRALAEALRRGGQVPGGTCGYWGVCGAAAGAGIYASILLGSTPLNKAAWPAPQSLTARCLTRNAEIGGPRCCKRTCRTAIIAASEFTEEALGVAMPCRPVKCRHYERNRECIRSACPYYGEKAYYGLSRLVQRL